MIGGWIYSKPVGWLDSMFADTVDWNYGWPMVGLPIGSFVIWSVGQSVEPSGRFAITD